jgi:PTS system mannitol-specific IIC component
MTTTSAPTAAPPERVSMRVHVQRFGTFLSNMIMPNIAAIIAWGLITAFFIPDGWIPNEKIATVVGPTITYLLPILIAYTGGKLVYDVRGGVVGGFAVIGVILATSDPIFIGDKPAAPMFLGAMIMGPFTAYVMKHIDALWAGKIKPGFEMLVDNFSAGIWAAISAIGGMFLLAPVLREVTEWLGNAVDWLVSNDLLPFTSVFIEPAKVLFLNNAINHGVLTPLGIQQAAENGQSVLFLLEANPAAGFGLLMAYTVFGKGTAKATAPGAAIIQFLGGIHEVYFPYVLMKPRLILAMIAGGMTQIFVNVVFDSGLRAPRCTGIDLRGLRTDAAGQLGRGDAVGHLRRGRLLHRRVPAAADGQGRYRGGGPDRRDGRDGGDEGQEVGGDRRGARRLRQHRPDPLCRVRLRRRHGLVRDGCVGAPQEVPGRRVLGRHGRQQGDREPH